MSFNLSSLLSNMSTTPSRSPYPAASPTFSPPGESLNAVSASLDNNTHPVNVICVCQPSSECVCVECKRCCPNAFPASDDKLLAKHTGVSSYGTISPAITSPQQSIRCQCHVVETKSTSNKTARNKLILACLIALLFVTGEAVGTRY